MLFRPFAESAELVATADGKSDGILEGHRFGLDETRAHGARQVRQERIEQNWFGEWSFLVLLLPWAGSSTRQSECLAMTVCQLIEVRLAHDVDHGHISRIVKSRPSQASLAAPRPGAPVGPRLANGSTWCAAQESMAPRLMPILLR